MAGNDDSDYDRLLAEVEAATGRTQPTGRTQTPRAGAGGEPQPQKRRRGRRSDVALAAAAVAGGGVFVLFALLPFLGAISGAIGAFLGAYVAVFLLRRG